MLPVFADHTQKQSSQAAEEPQPWHPTLLRSDCLTASPSLWLNSLSFLGPFFLCYSSLVSLEAFSEVFWQNLSGNPEAWQMNHHSSQAPWPFHRPPKRFPLQKWLCFFSDLHVVVYLFWVWIPFKLLGMIIGLTGLELFESLWSPFYFWGWPPLAFRHQGSFKRKFNNSSCSFLSSKTHWVNAFWIFC